MRTLQQVEYVGHPEPGRLEFVVDGVHRLHLCVLGERLFRVWLQPDGASLLDRTWMIDPTGDAPWEGRERASLAGFDVPSYEWNEGFRAQREGRCATSSATNSPPTLGSSTSVGSISTEQLRVTVHTAPLRLVWECRDSVSDWVELIADRWTSAYSLGQQGVSHHQLLHPEHRIFGLGEKTGDLERTGRRFEFRNLDAMGYDAARTDPLYKHVPFTMTLGAAQPFALLYDNLATSWFDLGAEIDNYHPRSRSYRAECGDLDYYFFTAADPEDLTREAVRLTGGCAFLPKWSLGYSGSTMLYTDLPNSAEALHGFIDGCREHSIPCDSFHLSSGYTSIGDSRYVFTWNRQKFPDPGATAADFDAAGMHVLANIKPALLKDHPLYQDCRANNLFVSDTKIGGAEESYFWGGWASHLDFTNLDTVAWWQRQVTTQLLDLGFDSTWNDNNEFEVWVDEARCHGFGRAFPLAAARAVQPLLMVRASREAQLAHAPDLRPHAITRSGPLGLQRYAQTWSGDNDTSWDTLAFNTRMGVGMSLSGLLNIGHDIGGFTGPKPDAELFTRWVQNGALMPRFSIHSWNNDGTANEPWMHPDALADVRAAIELRYRLLPYLYTCLWSAHTEHRPMVRPVFFRSPDDPQAYAESWDYLVGPELLVASVVEPGARTREIYLPAGGQGWCEFDTGRWHPPGRRITLEAPLSRLPLLVRAGGVIPLSERTAYVDQAADDAWTFAVFPAPPEAGVVETTGVIFDDDGITNAWADGDCLVVRWTLVSDASGITLSLARAGERQPPWWPPRCVVPQGEQRPLFVRF